MSLPNGQRVIALDFDGVVNDYHGWNNGVLDTPPIPGILDLVECLRELGAHVVLHTTRKAEDIKPWLAEHGFPPMDVYNEKWSRIDVFVDDRAVTFHPADVVPCDEGDDAVGDLAEYLMAFEPHWRKR